MRLSQYAETFQTSQVENHLASEVENLLEQVQVHFEVALLELLAMNQPSTCSYSTQYRGKPQVLLRTKRKDVS